MAKEKEFSKTRVLKVARRALKSMEMCNNCLGRQVAQVSTGLTNNKRGRILRKMLNIEEPDNCSVCGGLFKKLGKWAAKIQKSVEKIEFSTFVVGSSIGSLLEKEETLWESVGIELCEPIKSEINREVGKIIEKKLKKKASLKDPDIVIFLKLDAGTVEVQLRPIFIYGKYKKLVRGIPQTKWSTYKTTVEDIVAKPVMKASLTKEHAFHGSGREDIDARCLDWRPFILEMKHPKRRSLKLRSIQAEINKSAKVRVTGLKLSTKKEVVKLKASRPDKTYRLLVEFSKPPESLEGLKKLVGEVEQKTPLRVVHRRSDILRIRRVKEIKGKLINKKKAEIIIRGEAGLYVKELVSGDDGRTRPSVSSVIGPAKVKELDVIKIHLPKR